jgi:nicotinamide-nucleotide amidase
MAEGALQHSHAHVALAVSGVAGPTGGTPEKPVGTVWFAWSLRNGDTVAQVHHLDGTRAEVRYQSVQIALQGVQQLLKGLTASA